MKLLIQHYYFMSRNNRVGIIQAFRRLLGGRPTPITPAQEESQPSPIQPPLAHRAGSRPPENHYISEGAVENLLLSTIPINIINNFKPANSIQELERLDNQIHNAIYSLIENNKISVNARKYGDKDPRVCEGNENPTLLYLAVRFGYYKTMKLLIESGADINLGCKFVAAGIPYSKAVDSFKHNYQSFRQNHLKNLGLSYDNVLLTLQEGRGNMLIPNRLVPSAPPFEEEVIPVTQRISGAAAPASTRYPSAAAPSRINPATLLELLNKTNVTEETIDSIFTGLEKHEALRLLEENNYEAIKWALERRPELVKKLFEVAKKYNIEIKLSKEAALSNLYSAIEFNHTEVAQSLLEYIEEKKYTSSRVADMTMHLLFKSKEFNKVLFDSFVKAFKKDNFFGSYHQLNYQEISKAYDYCEYAIDNGNNYALKQLLEAAKEAKKEKQLTSAEKVVDEHFLRNLLCRALSKEFVTAQETICKEVENLFKDDIKNLTKFLESGNQGYGRFKGAPREYQTNKYGLFFHALSLNPNSKTVSYLIEKSLQTGQFNDMVQHTMREMIKINKDRALVILKALEFPLHTDTLTCAMKDPDCKTFIEESAESDPKIKALIAEHSNARLIDEAKKGNIESVKEILQKAKSIIKPDTIEYALEDAITQRHVEIVKLLLPQLSNDSLSLNASNFLFVVIKDSNFSKKEFNQEIFDLLFEALKKADINLSKLCGLTINDSDNDYAFKKLLEASEINSEFLQERMESAIHHGSIKIAAIILNEVDILAQKDPQALINFLSPDKYYSPSTIAGAMRSDYKKPKEDAPKFLTFQNSLRKNPNSEITQALLDRAQKIGKLDEMVQSAMGHIMTKEERLATNILSNLDMSLPHCRQMVKSLNKNESCRNFINKIATTTPKVAALVKWLETQPIPAARRSPTNIEIPTVKKAEAELKKAVEENNVEAIKEKLQNKFSLIFLANLFREIIETQNVEITKLFAQRISQIEDIGDSDYCVEFIFDATYNKHKDYIFNKEIFDIVFKLLEDVKAFDKKKEVEVKLGQTLDSYSKLVFFLEFVSHDLNLYAFQKLFEEAEKRDLLDYDSLQRILVAASYSSLESGIDHSIKCSKLIFAKLEDIAKQNPQENYISKFLEIPQRIVSEQNFDWYDSKTNQFPKFYAFHHALRTNPNSSISQKLVELSKQTGQFDEMTQGVIKNMIMSKEKGRNSNGAVSEVFKTLDLSKPHCQEIMQSLLKDEKCKTFLEKNHNELLSRYNDITQQQKTEALQPTRSPLAPKLQLRQEQEITETYI